MNRSSSICLVVVVVLVPCTNGTARDDVTVQGRTLKADGSPVKIKEDKISAVYVDSNSQFGDSQNPNGAGGYSLSLPKPKPSDLFLLRRTSFFDCAYHYGRSLPQPSDTDFSTTKVDIMYYLKPQYIEKFGKDDFKKHLEHLLKITPKDHPGRKHFQGCLDEIR
jgi:hypothetical protein